MRPETPPEVLSHAAFKNMRTAYLEFLRLAPERRAQTRQPDRSLPDLAGLLAAVAEPFGGRCAFCGRDDRLKVYRFRPTADARSEKESFDPLEGVTRDESDSFNPMKWRSIKGVTEPDPLHYGWLADAWQNLYPICAGCRPSDLGRFTVLGKRAPIPEWADYAVYANENTGRWPYPISEKAFLIDPCEDDPASEIEVMWDGKLAGLTDRGIYTIHFFNLNRPDLIAWRPKSLAVAPQPSAPKRRVRKPRPALRRWDLACVELENFKVIERLSLDMPTAPIVPAGEPQRAAALLILGENAAGKSTILEAVALCLMSDAARRRVAQNPAALLLNPRLMGSHDLPARTTGRVTVRFVSEEEQAEVTLRLSPEGFTAERIGKELPQVFAYGAYRHYLDGVRGRATERGVISLFRSDSLLSNPRDWLLGLPPTRFDEVVQVLRFVFNVDFEAIRRRDGECMVVTMTDGVEQRTPLLAVSSGFRTVLAMVCDVLRWLMDAPATRQLKLVEMPALILIDEVEAHLHPRWKMAIVDGLRQALPASTFLVTTHDPLCLRRAAPGEVRVLTRQRTQGDSGTDLPVMVEALQELPHMGALTVDQLLTADFFALGDTDDPASVRALEDLMAQHSAGVTELGGSPVVRRLQEQLLNDLPIGRTEVERVVQEAVAAFLSERRSRRPKWRERTRQRILSALRDL